MKGRVPLTLALRLYGLLQDKAQRKVGKLGSRAKPGLQMCFAWPEVFLINLSQSLKTRIFRIKNPDFWLPAKKKPRSSSHSLGPCSHMARGEFSSLSMTCSLQLTTGPSTPYCFPKLRRKDICLWDLTSIMVFSQKINISLTTAQQNVRKHRVIFLSPPYPASPLTMPKVQVPSTLWFVLFDPELYHSI